MTTALPLSFNRLAGANLAAQSAEQLSLAATPLVAVVALGAGPGEIGLLATAQTLPFLLLSIPFGLLADRTSRKQLMVVCEVLRAISLLGLLACVLLAQLSIPVLAVLGFVGAVGTVGFSVAAPALVPSLVPREALARANGRLELARSAAFAAGPALAGALVSWAGASTAFALATMLSACAVALLWRVRETARTPVALRHPWLELQDGARFVAGHRLLPPILFTAIAWNLSWFVLQAAYIPYAVRLLGMSPSMVGFTLATYGVGMVGGRCWHRASWRCCRLARPLLSGLRSQCWPLSPWWPLWCGHRRCSRLWHFSYLDQARLCGPSLLPRCAKWSPLGLCWAACRPCSSR
jgi:MFS family permease